MPAPRGGAAVSLGSGAGWLAEGSPPAELIRCWKGVVSVENREVRQRAEASGGARVESDAPPAALLYLPYHKQPLEPVWKARTDQLIVVKNGFITIFYLHSERWSNEAASSTSCCPT